MQHRAPFSINGVLTRVIGRQSTLPIREPVDQQPPALGQVYLAPPDHHLLLQPEKMRVIRGPKENFVRPAIDVLFRSAAVAYGPRVIAVVLSGNLDDGSAGSQAVKRCGGIAVVQDPKDAMFPDMPANAMTQGPADHVVRLAEMSKVLEELVRQPAPAAAQPPEDLRKEVEMSMGSYELLDGDEKPLWSPYVCPECGGALADVPNADPPRYRCHVGHSFTEQSLIADQSESTERVLWAAIRALEERAKLLRSMAAHSRQRGAEISAADYSRESEQSRAHAEHIRGWFTTSE